MDKGYLRCAFYSIVFLPLFLVLLLLGIVKAIIFSPFVFLVIAFGDIGIIIALWPVYLVWSIRCIIRTKMFSPYLKCLLIIITPIPIALWTVVGACGSVVMGIGYGFVWPVMETFKAISKEDTSLSVKLITCFTAGTWSNVWGACTTVRDFADFSFHSYFCVMDGIVEATVEEPIDHKITEIAGYVLAALLGVLVDVPIITLISLYKAPILLIKGWQRLVHDLIGREGPFLETVCVPFAGLLILLWPFIVLLATCVGIISSLGFGFYAAVVAYKENSTKRGLLYVIASASIFDEYTNDLLYLREGSCFPRPKYGSQVDLSPSLLRVSTLRREQSKTTHANEPLIAPSGKTDILQAVVVWDNYIRACKEIGIELVRVGAIKLYDLDAWRQSKNKIVHVGIPAYAFLKCFLRSIKNDSPGFILSDNVELTCVNRPEGRVFDWFYEPMSIMKEQIRILNLVEAEELYLYKYCLFSDDAERMSFWENGGIPPKDEIRRAQLEGISRRLQGFCLVLSRLPTSRRRILEVLKAIEQEARKSVSIGGGYDIEAAI